MTPFQTNRSRRGWLTTPPLGVALLTLAILAPAPAEAQTEYHFPPRVLEHLPEWAPGSEVLASVGREDGGPEHYIGALNTAVLLPDGGLALVDNHADWIRVFSPDGILRLRFARRGEGPGEFRTYSRIEVLAGPGGGFTLWRSASRSLFLYGADGEFLSSVRGPDGPQAPVLLGARGGGSFLFQLSALDTAPLQPGVMRFDTAIVVETRVDDVGQAAHSEWSRTPDLQSLGRGETRARLRFVTPGPTVPPRAILAVTPDGTLIRGTSDRWELEWWTPDGGVEHRVTLDFPEQTVDDVHRERMVPMLAGTRNLGPGESRTTEQARLERSAQELLRGIERGESVAGFRVYSGGEIVVGAPRHPGEPPAPLLLSERGRPLGWLVNDPDELGHYPQVLDIRGDRILLRVQDPVTDVVHLEVRPFRPRPAAPAPAARF
jgi:hypothetical protein